MDWRSEVGDKGFAIRRNVFPANWLNETLARDIESSRTPTKPGIRHAMRFESIRALAGSPQLRELACEVLGPRAFAFRATVFDKSPAANWLVVWHQDTALPLRARMEAPGWNSWSTKEGINYAHAPAQVLCRVLALRIHLDDSSSDNGPLRVLPGTHSLGILSDEWVHELAEQVAAVECVVPKGGVLAMHPLLVHASSKSHSKIPRRVLHIEYAASPLIADPLELEIA
jgi:ectoine hydroxylase-related dioxygenase (phytanoyl-CoA dioxygenase family)